MLSLHQPSHSAPLFLSFNKEILRELNKNEHVRYYKKKQVLYYEGNPVVGVYYIKSGKAKVYKTGPEGRQYTLKLARENDVLALESIFKNDSYFSSSSEMVEDGMVCLVEKQIVLNLLRKDNHLAMSMMMMLASQVISSEEQMVDLAHRAVRERLARLLLVLSHGYGVKVRQGVKLNLELTREDIAEMIGTCSKSAIRLLSELKEDGIVEIKGKDIVILDEPRLVEIAQLDQ